MAAAQNLHPQVDMELKKAFEELQIKMISNRNQVKVITAQAEQLKRQIQHSKLTEAELAQLDSSVRMYEGIGRMFVLSEKDNILKNLKEKVTQCENKISSLDKTKDYLDKGLKDSENSLRELITAKQGKK
jgi:prefoldin subunit 1